MEEHKKNTKNGKKEVQGVNPLLMVDPSMMGTPLGPLPIVPMPMLNIEDYKERPEEKNGKDR